MLGFAAGVMIAASFWSLLAPAIEISENLGVAGWIPAVIGFLMGGIFLRLVDMVLPHLHPALAKSEPEGIKTKWQRSVLLVLAVTLHNFPEGLAVGVAFGAVADISSASIAGAVALALGIGLQNFPEGAAVSIPLRREGLSATKSFMYGQLSGVVEPVSFRCCCCYLYETNFALCISLCSWSNDFCGRGRADSGSQFRR